MSRMAQVEDGEVVRVGLPRTGTLSDGRKLSNYRKRMEDDSDLATAEGWLPVEPDSEPDHDPDTERVRAAPRSEWTVESDRVVQTWQVTDRPDPAPDVDGLLDHLGEELPRETARRVLDGYVVSAMSRGRFQRAWDALADSRDSGDLNSEQWDAIVQAAEAHHVPGPEGDQ